MLVTVDNTPPVLTGLQLVAKRLRGRAVDGVGPIARIEVSVAGTNEWIPLNPTDAIFDESAQGFDVNIGDWLPAGKHLIAVRAYDSANNFRPYAMWSRGPDRGLSGSVRLPPEWHRATWPVVGLPRTRQHECRGWQVRGGRKSPRCGRQPSGFPSISLRN